MSTDQKKLGFGAVILWLGLLYSFWDTFSYHYVDFDDPDYLVHHPLSKLPLLSVSFWQELFTSSTVNLWHPLSVLSHQIMLRLTSDWGVHHGLNFLLHGLTAMTWGALLYKVTKQLIAVIIACLLFAWHPVTVESVAWISGRKDVLCGLFLALASLSYVQWFQTKKRGYYIFSLCVGILAMLSKPIGFLVPVVIFLFDLWPLGRIGRLADVWGVLREKLAFIVPAVLTVLLTLYFQSEGGQAVEDTRSYLERGAGAVWSYQHAIVSMLFPTQLHLGYEDPKVVTWFYTGMMSFVGICLIVAAIFFFKRAPYFFIGLMLIILFLAPTAGLIRAGNHLAADRYCYLPMLGVSLMVAGALTNRKQGVMVLFSGVSLLFLFMQKRQVETWESLETLSQHALGIAPKNPSANAQLALIHYQRNEREEAVDYAERVLEQSPQHVGANLLLATMAINGEDWEKAEKHYYIAAQLRENDILVWYHLAHSLIAQSKYESGFGYLQKARDLSVMQQDNVMRDVIDSEMQSWSQNSE